MLLELFAGAEVVGFAAGADFSDFEADVLLLVDEFELG